MKKLALLLVSALTLFSATAQKKNFTYKFYGFVRGDLFYNTRANMAPVDGNFYLFPLDEKPDADGKDLNATPNGSFYTFTSRLGLRRLTSAAFREVRLCCVSVKHGSHWTGRKVMY